MVFSFQVTSHRMFGYFFSLHTGRLSLSQRPCTHPAQCVFFCRKRPNNLLRLQCGQRLVCTNESTPIINVLSRAYTVLNSMRYYCRNGLNERFVVMDTGESGTNSIMTMLSEINRRTRETHSTQWRATVTQSFKIKIK